MSLPYPWSLVPGVGLEPTGYSRGVYRFCLRQSPISRPVVSFGGSANIDETCSVPEHYCMIYLSLLQLKGQIEFPDAFSMHASAGLP